METWALRYAVVLSMVEAMFGVSCLVFGVADDLDCTSRGSDPAPHLQTPTERSGARAISSGDKAQTVASWDAAEDNTAATMLS